MSNSTGVALTGSAVTPLGTVPLGGFILIQNPQSNSATVYVGPGTDINASNGIEVYAGGNLSFSYPVNPQSGATSGNELWSAYCASGQTVKVLIGP